MPGVVILFGLVFLAESVCEFTTGHTLPGKRGPVRMTGSVEPYVSLLAGILASYFGWAWRKFVLHKIKTEVPNRVVENN